MYLVESGFLNVIFIVIDYGLTVKWAIFATSITVIVVTVVGLAQTWTPALS
jgi:hypothetical protein